MGTRTATNAEVMVLHKTADEYQGKGYEVEYDVSLDFFPNYRADLVVQKDGQCRIIEVKQRTTLAADPKVRELAHAVDKMPGWSFELVLVGTPEQLDAPDGARPIGADGIRKQLDRAVEVTNSGHAEAGFMLAWAALEAKARLLAANEGESHEGITTSDFILEQMLALDIISSEEHDFLNEWRKVRNALVHGFTVEGFDRGVVADLIGAIRRLHPQLG